MRSSMRLLLVEDSLRLQGLLADALRRESYEIDAVATVAELLNSIAVAQYNLIIVDLGLPDGDGLAAIRTLRSIGHSTPILIMTARGSIGDRVGGLDKEGAHARQELRIILRRPSDLQGPILKFGRVE